MPAESADLGDDRIIRESGIDARVAAIIEPVLRGIGFRLVRVRLFGQNGLTLQIMAEREDGTMTVEDCEDCEPWCFAGARRRGSLSRRPIISKCRRPASTGRWCASRTSPLARPVGQARDLRPGRRAQALPRQDRRGETGIVLERDQAAYGEAPTVRIPFDTIAEARLVLTDDLIRDALSKDNRARKEAKRRAASGEPEETDEDRRERRRGCGRNDNEQ